MSNPPRHADAPNRPLHVVEIIDSLGAGGAESLLALRVRQPHRPARRVDVVSLGEKDALADAIRPHVDSVRFLPWPRVFDVARIRELCALLRRLRPDLIHTHLRMSNTVGSLCGRLTGIPVVATLHSIFPEPGRAHARRDRAERWSLRLFARTITAVGPSVAEAHRDRFGARAIEVIANPVELPLEWARESFEPGRRRDEARARLDLPIDPAARPVILTVARLIGIKGFPASLDIVRSVCARRPDVLYLIAGDGELRESLQRRIDAHGLRENVLLLGRSIEVRRLMAASDLFLLASSGEGLPLVLLEAMSMHLPVVATAVGDVPGLLEHGRCGELVSPADIDGTAKVLIELLDAPERREALAERAYRRVAESYSMAAWLDALRETYVGVLSPSRRAALPPAAASRERERSA